LTHLSFKTCLSCGEKKQIELFLSRGPNNFRSTCKECHRVKEAKRRQSNREEYNKAAMLRYEADKEKKKELMRLYAKNNKDKIKERRKKWAAKNIAKIIANNKKRQFAIKSRIPPWATKEMLDEIAVEYEFASLASKVTGKKFHVDHIIPINGETVSGFHVPSNLRVLLGAENIAKKNKIDKSLFDSW